MGPGKLRPHSLVDEFKLVHILQSHIVWIIPTIHHPFPLLFLLPRLHLLITCRVPEFQRTKYIWYSVCILHFLWRPSACSLVSAIIAPPTPSPPSQCPSNVHCYCSSYCPLYLSWTTHHGSSVFPPAPPPSPFHFFHLQISSSSFSILSVRTSCLWTILLRLLSVHLSAASAAGGTTTCRLSLPFPSLCSSSIPRKTIKSMQYH